MTESPPRRSWSPPDVDDGTTAEAVGSGAPPKPSASAGSGTRGAIDTFVQAAVVDLFQAYGVAVAPLPRTSLHRGRIVPEVCAMIAFSPEGGTEQAGRLTLAAPRIVLGSMRGVEQASHREDDWCRELASQLLGRIKKRLLHFGITLRTDAPVDLDPRLLEEQLHQPSNIRIYAGRTLRGEILVTLLGHPQEGDLEYLGSSTMTEGDLILF